MNVVENSQKVKSVWYYDLECFTNFFSIYAINRDTEEHRYYYIHDSLNQIYEIYNFLYYECGGMIGFNNINYDYPMLHYFMTDLRYHENQFNDAEYVCNLLHDYSTALISRKDTYPPVKEWEIMIPQLDIFRIHHFDNKMKRTSLKAVEYVMRAQNIENMPIEHDQRVLVGNIGEVLYYNKNDVIETKRFVEASSDMIELRKQISQEYGFNTINYNDTKIGAELFLRFICTKLGLNLKEVRQRRTQREFVDLKNCILPYINFKTPEFQNLLNKFKDTCVFNTNSPFKYKVNFRGISYEYGVGGLHGAVNSGIYVSDDEWQIIDIDVASYYPSLAIVNRFYPAHLGPEFCDIYKDRFDYRMSLKVKENKTAFEKLAISLWKLALNGVYGKSGDINSFFYDIEYMLKITVNGQLLLTMLAERLLLNIPEAHLLQANTDGITIKLPRKEYKILEEWCKRWEELTGLVLEYTSYKKMVIQDVNNYLGVYDKPEDELYTAFPKSTWYDNHYTKHKTKGMMFQVVKEQNGAIAFNKNWSYTIVSKALYNYFVYDIPVADTIKQSNDIYDFCARVKTTKDWYGEYIDTTGVASTYTGVIRYYMSPLGGKLKKKYISGKISGRIQDVEANGRVIICNRMPQQQFTDFNVDYSYYMKRANDIIMKIKQNGQMKLFEQ